MDDVFFTLWLHEILESVMQIDAGKYYQYCIRKDNVEKLRSSNSESGVRAV